MMNFVKSAFEDADILVYMVEIGEQNLKDESFFNKIIHAQIPVLLLLNKIDISNQEKLEEQVAFWAEKVPNAEIFPIGSSKLIICSKPKAMVSIVFDVIVKRSIKAAS